MDIKDYYYLSSFLIGKKMGVIAFVSYATKDSKDFQIKSIAEKLTEYPEIDNVLYWEEDMHDDIIKYMNDNLKKCHLFLLFCSQNSMRSEPVEMEWTAALKLKKKIIPIFNNTEDIPPLLTTKLGVQFNKRDIHSTINEIYNLILKKMNIQLITPDVKEKETAETPIKEVSDLTTTYKGKEILFAEKEVLEDIIKSIKKSFSVVLNLKWGSFGVNIQFKHIIGLGLYTDAGLGVQSLPESIGDLKWLQKLSLINNKLTKLPNSFGKLESLEILWLNKNKIVQLPESFGNLKSLKNLDMSNNKLSSLPESFGNLSSINVLQMQGNKLESLPNSFGNLKSLRELDLFSNKLSSLPESFGNLSSLSVLYLHSNNLNSLPGSFNNLTNLKRLYLNNNKFRNFPNLSLKNLRGLDIGYNQLLSVPESIDKLESIQALIIRKNNINKLPESMLNLSNLRELRAEDLPLEESSYEILEKLQRRGIDLGAEVSFEISKISSQNKK